MAECLATCLRKAWSFAKSSSADGSPSPSGDTAGGRSHLKWVARDLSALTCWGRLLGGCGAAATNPFPAVLRRAARYKDQKCMMAVQDHCMDLMISTTGAQKSRLLVKKGESRTLVVLCREYGRNSVGKNESVTRHTARLAKPAVVDGGDHCLFLR